MNGFRLSVARQAEQIDDVSESLLVRHRVGKYQYVVKEGRRKGICEFYGVDEDQLFPFVGANEEKAS